jgi:hypothetical protein
MGQRPATTLLGGVTASTYWLEALAKVPVYLSRGWIKARG